MTLLTSIAVPILVMAQGFTLAIGQKEGDTSKIKTEDIENITFTENPGSDTSDSKFGLTLKLKSGEPVSFLLADKPVISFDGDQCVIECKDFKNILEMKDIDFGSFGELTGVESAAAEKMMLDLSNPSAAVVRGLTPGENVALYTIDGRLLQNVAAGNDGCATIELSEIAQGTVCIVSINGTNNFKLIKK